MNNIVIPQNIKAFIGDVNYKIDNIGCSNSKVLIFEDKVLKIEKINEESDVENRMLKWLQNKLPVPEIIVSCRENGYNYLLMSKLNGEMICEDEYIKNPEQMVKLLALGLKKLWKVDVSFCPVINNLDKKLALAKERIENGLVDMENVHPSTFTSQGFKNPMGLYKFLEENRPDEEITFVHGDFCFPNIFVSKDNISGYIDLGRSGAGDKWQDIALCIRSMEHNLGTNKYKSLLLNKLGLKENKEKIKYYILLDELF